MARFPRRARPIAGALALALASLCLSSAALAQYTGGSVTSGGSIRGTVRFTGTVPAAELIPVQQDASACGDTIVSDVLVVGASKGVANAIVSIEGIGYGKRPAAHADSLPRVAASQCHWVPRAQIATVGERLNVANWDGALHNVHAVGEKGETLFNLSLPGRSYFVRKELKKPGLVTVRCEAGHPWMTAYVLVMEHPYGAATDSSGAYVLDQVPAGTYTLRVWHEALGMQTRQVTVRPEEATTEDWDFTTIPAGALAPLAPPPAAEPPAPGGTGG